MPVYKDLTAPERVTWDAIGTNTLVQLPSDSSGQAMRSVAERLSCEALRQHQTGAWETEVRPYETAARGICCSCSHK